MLDARKLRPKLARRRAEEMRDEGVEYVKDAVQTFYQSLTKLTLTTAFYRGQQYGRVSRYGGFKPADSNLYEAQETNNYVRRFVNAAVSENTRSLPNPEIIAAHSDPEAMARAIAATQLARSFFRNGVIPFDVLYDACLLAQIHGAAWLKAYWDPDAGRIREASQRMRQSAVDPERWEPEMDDFGDPVEDQMFEGEIRVEAKSIADVLRDPTARSVHKMRYVVELEAHPITRVKEWWPEDFFGEDVAWDTNHRENMGAEEAIEFADPFDDEGQYQTYRDNDIAEIASIYELPSRTYPRGRHIILHGQALLHVDRLADEFPFVLVNGHNRTGTGMYADGAAADTIGIQKSINRVASKQREILDRAATDILLEPVGANLKLNQMSDVSGYVLQHEYGYPPKWIDRPPVDPSMTNYHQHNVEVLKDVTSFTDVALGDDTPQASGRSIAYKSEIQRGILAPLVHITRMAFTELMGKCLRIGSRKYRDGRLIQMFGPNNAWMVRHFKKDEFDFDHQLVTELYSGSPHSRALRFGEALEALPAGGLDDSPQAERFRRIVGWDHEGRSTVDADEIDNSVALAENANFMADPFGPLLARAEDNHDIHVDAHNLLRKSMSFRSLPTWIQAAMDAHVERHEDLRMTQFSSQVAQQGMIPGGRGPGRQPALGPGAESPLDGGHSLYETPVASAHPEQGPATPGMQAQAAQPQAVPTGFIS